MKYRLFSSEASGEEVVQEFVNLSGANEAISQLDPDLDWELHKNGKVINRNHIDELFAEREPYEKPAVIAERPLEDGESLESEAVLQSENGSARNDATTQEETENGGQAEAKAQEDHDSTLD